VRCLRASRDSCALRSLGSFAATTLRARRNESPVMPGPLVVGPGKARSFAQVGEWLKPTDCKSVPPCEVRRFESSPVHQLLRRLCGPVRHFASEVAQGKLKTSEAGARSRNPERSEGARAHGSTSSESLNCRFRRLCGPRDFGVDDDQRPKNQAGDAGGSGNVRRENLGEAEGLDALRQGQ
jgi:hypothetical protein